MTLLFFDGFGSAASGIANKPQWNTGVALANAGRNGGYCLFGDNNFLTIPASAKVTYGSAFNNASNGSLYNTIYGDSGVTAHLTIQLSSTGSVILRRGGETGTSLATAPTGTFVNGTWRHFQVQATIADSGGRCIVKIDGTTVIDYTGDTKNAGTSTNIDMIEFGASSASTGYLYDDVWVCDGVDATATQGRPNNDFLGDLKVAVLMPDGAGALTQWTPTTAVANYTTVDDATPTGTTDYVSTSVVGSQDLYTIQDLPSTAGTVYGVQACVYASKSDAGAANIKTLIRESGGTITAGTAQALSVTWQGYAGTMRASKPGTATPWTVADVNALQVGIESA